MTAMVEKRRPKAIPAIGIALGLVIALAAVLFWRVPAESQSLGADVRFAAAPAGAVSVSPAGPLLTASRLLPGHSATDRFELRNLTGRPLRVRLRALPSGPALDRALRVDVAAAGHQLAAGRLGELRSFASGAPLTLPVEGSREVELRAELLRAAGRDHEGQIIDVMLEFEARRAGAVR